MGDARLFAFRAARRGRICAADCLRECGQLAAFASRFAAEGNCRPRGAGSQPRCGILRQLFTESVLLALGGGALGILFSFVCVHWVHVLGPKSVPRLASIGVDGEALLFTVALCVFSGILFGLAPAWRATQIDLHSTLKDAGRGSAGAGSVWGRGRNLRRMLVISEMALSVVLLIGAGLLIRSFARLLHVSPGFNPAECFDRRAKHERAEI